MAWVRKEDCLTEVVGVYLQPPKDAVVLCVDEKSQIQALDRSQSGLPLKRGRCGTFTHDYKRHGTTCLFAALHVSNARVLAEHYPRHRHQEFLRFLRRIDSEFPPPRTLHLILDNYATHGHARVRAWLRKRPRFVLHVIPTSSSWLNLIERWIAELEQKTVRRGTFRNVEELQRAMDAFLAAWNDEPVLYTGPRASSASSRRSSVVASASSRSDQAAPSRANAPSHSLRRIIAPI